MQPETDEDKPASAPPADAPETRFIDGMGWVVACRDATKYADWLKRLATEESAAIAASAQVREVEPLADELDSARRLIALLMRQPVGSADAPRLESFYTGLPHHLVLWAQKLGVTPGNPDPDDKPAAVPVPRGAGGRARRCAVADAIKGVAAHRATRR